MKSRSFRRDGPLGHPAPPFSSYMGRSWPRMLRGISKVLALLLGAGWGPEVSSPGSFCFLTHAVLRSHAEVSLLTSFALWMLEPELNHVGGTWGIQMTGCGVSVIECSLNKQ